MSNKPSDTKPAAPKPAITAKATRLPAIYQHPNGAVVHYHDDGHAFNAQRRYVGGANEPLAAAAAEAIAPKETKQAAATPVAESAPAEQPAATPAAPAAPAQSATSQPGKGR